MTPCIAHKLAAVLRAIVQPVVESVGLHCIRVCEAQIVLVGGDLQCGGSLSSGCCGAGDLALMSLTFLRKTQRDRYEATSIGRFAAHHEP